ncbi:MAG: galactose oxidase early set domain-containing protein, partial [Candidatus Acidiferrum sp.]
VDQSNPPVNSHADAQLFSPPYLFKGPRPVITKAPAKVGYGEAFDVETPAPNGISQVSWIRLPSVTHSFDQNQRINFLTFERGSNKVTVTAPANGNLCPPGHYMLFLVNESKVPSVAAMIQIVTAAAVPNVVRTALAETATTAPADLKVFRQKSPLEKDADIQAEEKKPPVVVGVTPTCPYGISACWGGAYEALKHLDGVRLVRPVPNAQDSTAYVYLKHEGLPDLDVWPAEFASIANGTHIFRGVEVTVEGVLETREGNTLVLAGQELRPPVLLEPIQASDKIQWDATKGSQKPLDLLEQQAYVRLQEKVKAAGGSLRAKVTGPLKKSDHGYLLEVRVFSVAETNSERI